MGTTRMPLDAPVLLEVRGLHGGYGPIQVLHGLDFVVEAGSVTALLGANGAGKTTTLRAICGMIRTQGDISVAGQRITGLATEEVARLGVAHVPDGRGTFMELTVEENFRLGAYIRRDAGVQADFERMWEFFPRLRQRWKQQAGTLSGGEQQMMVIGRALMAKPKLLLLDEPSLGIAPKLVQDIARAIVAISRDEKVTVLLVEQNSRMALSISSRAYAMSTGSMVLTGDSKELMGDDRIKAAYLGGDL